MTPIQMLKDAVDQLERHPDRPGLQGKVYVWPHGSGRFPFLGGGTEKMMENTQHAAYFVPVHRVLSGLAKVLKAQEAQSKQPRAG